MNHKSNHPTLVVVLPRGETYRNFVYTGIIEELGKFTNQHIVAVLPNLALTTIIEKQAEVKELSNFNFSYFFELLHEITDLAHNRYMWSEAAQVRWNMRDVEAKGTKNRTIRVMKKGLAIMLAGKFQLALLDKITQVLSGRESSVKYWKAYFKKVKPSLVFNTSHSHARNAHAIVYAANALGIKTCTFLFSWDNLTSQGRVVPVYDYYFAWNSEIKSDFHTIYPFVSDSQVKVTGTPQFMGHFQTEKHLSKEDLFKKLGLKPNEKYFLYSSGMSHHLPEEPYVVERIADMLGELGEDYRLVVRTYAKDKHDVFASLKIRRPDIIIPEVNWEKNYQTPLPEDQAFFSSLLKFCIAGINVASTVSLELCMLDKPAINVAYNPPDKNIYPYNYTRFYNFDHYKPIVDSGAVELAYSEDELRWLLKVAITNPELKSRERMKLLNSFFNGSPSEITAATFSNSIMSIMNAELGEE
jgi:hypothetical protein